jgi:hypothetical protein
VILAHVQVADGRHAQRLGPRLSGLRLLRG